ncbi:hypothetical protein FHR50_002127 [Xanthomonas arboricola]
MDGFTACPASGEGTAPSTSCVCCRALARPPSRDTLQVHPCKLWRGIHAAHGPTSGEDTPSTLRYLLQFRRNDVTVQLTKSVILQSWYSSPSLLVTAQHLRCVHDIHAL